MLRRLLALCADLSAGRVVFLGLALAVAMEAVTVFTRFALGLQTTRDTAYIGTYSWGVRIHHGYLGVLLLPGRVGLRAFERIAAR